LVDIVKFAKELVIDPVNVPPALLSKDVVEPAIEDATSASVAHDDDE
jgi:hypothetical protein